MWVMVILTALVVLTVWSVYKRSFSYWKERGVPYPAPQLIFGNTRKLFFSLSYAEYFKTIYDQFPGEPVCGVYQFRSPVLVIRDPSIIQKVLIKDFSYFQDRRLSFNEKKEPLSAHLLNLRGSKWRSLRSKLTPTFTSKKMRMMFSLMMECAEELRKFLEQGVELDDKMEFKEIMARFTTDVIGTCAFGLKCNSMQNPNAEFRIMGKEVAQPSVNNLVRRVLVQALPFLKVRVLPPEVTRFFLTTVRNTMIYREKNGVIRNDFLQLLIELRKQGKVQNDDGDAIEDDKQVNGSLKTAGMMNMEFSDGMIAAQAFIFFLAGFETSSSTLSFCLHELAMNPDIQRKLTKEVDCELEKVEGNVTYESILNMTYLSKVVDETLRKYPPASNISRIVTKHCPVPGYEEGTKLLDVGVRVIIPVYALHHDPVYYPDPERFDPERFSDEVRSTRPGFTYLPFGDGPRNCIGMKFGLLQVKLGLVVLLSHFEFSICEKTQVPLKLDPKSFISTAKGGIWLRVTKREW